MMLKRRSDLLLLWSCWIVSWLDVGFGGRVLVTLLDAKPRSYFYEGQVATFGNQLESEAYYDANLVIPPGDPELCEYPSALEHLNATKNSTFRRTKQRSRVALLVKRGNCSFLTKALVALEISRQSSKWTVDLVLVYNNNKSEGATLLTPSSNATAKENKVLQELGLVFLSAKSGKDVLDQISSAEHAQNASAVLQAPSFDNWTFEIAVQQRAPDGGPPPSNSNGAGGQPQSAGGGGDTAPTFYWFRFVLFSILIVSPCVRAGYLWYAGGGRLRFRYNEQGRIIGIQYIPPMPYWYGATFIPSARPSEVTPCLTEEQVRALPIITYQPPQHLGDDDDEDIEEEHVIPAAGKHPRTNEQKDEEIGRPTPTTPPTNTSQEEHDEIHVPPENQSSSQYTTSCTTCSICIDDFRPGEQLRLLPLCRHAFHTECIMPWLTERQGCCPLCKSSVLEAQENTDVESSGQSELSAQPEMASASVQQSSPPITPMPVSYTISSNAPPAQPSALSIDLLPEQSSGQSELSAQPETASASGQQSSPPITPISYAISSNASPPAQPSALSIDHLPEQSSPLSAASTQLTRPAFTPPTTAEADLRTTPFDRVESAPRRS